MHSQQRLQTARLTWQGHYLHEMPTADNINIIKMMKNKTTDVCNVAENRYRLHKCCPQPLHYK